MKFKSIVACLDMFGCPNRCKHCWLGCTANGNMQVSELECIARELAPFTDNLEVFDWYREPDYNDNYKQLWDLSLGLSKGKNTREHFELISFWRIVRDSEYVNWLSSIGLKTAQLTIFGNEETTDFYVGRKGAFKEILQAIEILISNKISVRIQMFISKKNLDELCFVESLIKELGLEERCRAFGGEFSFFLILGSCEGENEKFYDSWITADDLNKVPKLLEEYTLQHSNKSRLLDVFGETEQSLYECLSTDNSTASYVVNNPVFYIDKDFYVYPNVTSPQNHWRLGNIKVDGIETVLENYVNNNSIAQRIRFETPICKVVQSLGDPTSQRLFSKNDYITFLLNKYCRI